MIPMFSPIPDYKIHEKEYDDAIKEVLSKGNFINGQQIKTLESKLATYIGTKHCIATSSGTDALLISLMALDIRPGDEIITTPFTWISSSEIILLLQAKPVFVDIDPKSYNLNPLDIEKKITKKTRAILPVNLYGQCADYSAINAIAGKYGIPVVEDGAQSFGAIYQGKKSCSLGTIGCTSFFPTKVLGCYGDGGACFTNDDILASKMRAIRNHGGQKRQNHEMVGINGRLDTIQASILLVKFKYLEGYIKRRNEIAQKYNTVLPDSMKPYFTDSESDTDKLNRHVYGQYTIRLKSEEERDHVRNILKENGISSSVFYEKSLHEQDIFIKMLGKQTFPESEKASKTVLSIPCYPELYEEPVINAIKKYFTQL